MPSVAISPEGAKQSLAGTLLLKIEIIGIQNIGINRQGWSLYFMGLAGPLSQINQLATFAAKWPMGELVAPLELFLASRTI